MNKPAVMKDLCETILDIDKRIRFAGITDGFGKLVISEYRKGSVPLLAEKESTLSVIQSTIVLGTRKTMQPKLGKIRYVVVTYEKVKLLTVPFPDGSILMVSFDGKGDHDGLVEEKILPHVKKRGPPTD